MRTEEGLVIYEVSEYLQYLNETLRAIADQSRLAIEGEVSSFSIAQGKWVRFDLKDANGLVNCFLTTYQLKVPLEDGMKIRVYGYPKVYERYGKFSITVQRIELVGEGALRRAFELLKQKLEHDGWFSEERKRSLPRFPERIGLITSREAAACGDFLRILSNRWSGVQVLLAHVQVQGEPSVRQIVSAFRSLNALARPPEVIVLTRGGGSMEDLAAFNSLEVARAIFSSRIPVIVGVGHERDETIADYVADVRASTPTNAAELVVPDRREMLYAVSLSSTRMSAALMHALREQKQRLAHSRSRLEAYVRRSLSAIQLLTAEFHAAARSYQTALHLRLRETDRAAGILVAHMTRRHRSWQERVTQQQRLLKNLDPKAVLCRGYAMVFDAKRHLIRDPATVDAGTALTVHLHKGILPVIVSKQARGQDALPLS
ncbi:exodeoxyribonuclease VII large subunit [Patescibacteria group bacterium]|nr:exodeoxyribonuclease VII large subunit [Patescibacteria group bacterium]